MDRKFGFTFGRTPEGNRQDYEALEKRLAQQPIIPVTNPPIVTPAPNVVPPIATNPSPTNLQFWTISDVNYRGIVGNVDVAKTLLENGTSKTQSDWANYSGQARTRGDFYTPDYPLFYASLEKAFDLKDEKAYKKQTEEMRTALKGLSRANWLMTLTRIKYAPKGKDTIIHNFGLNDKYELAEDFMGQDGFLPAGSPEKVYQSLLGTQNSLGKINDVFKWLNETQTYIWRVNSKPKSADERVAWFGAGSDRAVLYCDRDPTYSDSSLGVRFVARKKI